MPLSDYKARTVDVPFKGGSLLVRGLSLSDIALVITPHLSDMEKIFNDWQAYSKDVFSLKALEDMAAAAIVKTPLLAAEILALVTDDGSNTSEEIGRLPAGIQIPALLAALELTVEDAGGPKNFAALVQNALGQAAPMAKVLQQNK